MRYMSLKTGAILLRSVQSVPLTLLLSTFALAPRALCTLFPQQNIPLLARNADVIVVGEVIETQEAAQGLFTVEGVSEQGRRMTGRLRVQSLSDILYTLVKSGD